MSEPRIDLAHAERFLTLLDEAAECWHFRTFPEASGNGRNHDGELRRVADDLSRDNSNGRGVYVVVNEGGHDDDSITRVRALFADWDPPKTAPMPSELPLEPHLIVESSRGKHHAYWLVDGLQVHEFKSIQQAIAAQCGSDRTVCNPSRVMRLPGFVHRKPADGGHDGKPFLTHIIHESGAQPYGADAIRRAFPVGATPTASQIRSVHTVHGDIPDGSRDNTLTSLAGTMRRRGMSEPAILAALRVENEARCRPPLPLADVERIARSVAGYEPGDPALRMQGRPVGELRPVSLEGVLQRSRREWPHVIEFYCPRRVTTLLGGHGGVGKSMLALILAAHVAAGRPWGVLNVEQGRAVFLSFEDEAEVVLDRLRDVIQAYDLPADAVQANLSIYDGSDAETELAIEQPDGSGVDFTPMMGLVADAVRGAAFVVIDNASDTFGANENARRQVRAFIRRLSGEAKKNDAAVVLLAHIDKGAAKHGGKGNNFSGSTAWHNSVRSRLALVESEESGIELLHEKANYGPKHAPVVLLRAHGGVLEPVAPEAAAAARQLTKAATAKTDAEVVLRVFEALISNNVQIPTAETGQRTAYHVLIRAPEMPDLYRTAAGKERVKAAIQGLERDGRIAREQYRKPDRKMGERWTLPHLPVAEAA